MISNNIIDNVNYTNNIIFDTQPNINNINDIILPQRIVFNNVHNEINIHYECNEPWKW